MRSRIGVFAAILLVAAGLCVPAASAKAHMLIGIQDDSMTLHGNPQFTFSTMKQLRTQIVRINLNWNEVAKRRPAHPQDPADPAYDWTVYDRAIRYAGQFGMQGLLSILFTPSWANGGKPRNVPPNNYNDLQNFAYAAATRYSGHYIPNTDLSTRRTTRGEVLDGLERAEQPDLAAADVGRQVHEPASYARICTAVWQGVHFTNFPSEKVACGVTGPRGNNAPRTSRPSMSPLAFMRLTKAAGLKHLDAYAHNPYYGKPSETPKEQAGRKRRDAREHEHADRARQQAVGQEADLDHRVCVADAPDRIFGVSFARQAAYVKQSFAIARANPRIDLMVWFMLRDDTNITIGWQSGFLTAAGKKKPAFNVFARLPH